MESCCSNPGREYLEVRHSTVRFAGDSGDGMQLVGSQFADIASLSGCAIRTMPDYPSEIRAPAGSLAGVSGYQLRFGDEDITTPGDSPAVLVAMNPAALKVNLPEIERGGILVVNADEFMAADLAKAKYERNPLEDGSLGRVPGDPRGHDPVERGSHGGRAAWPAAPAPAARTSSPSA